MKELLRKHLGYRGHLVLYDSLIAKGRMKKEIAGQCFSASMIHYVNKDVKQNTYDFYFPMNTLRIYYDSTPIFCPLTFEEIHSYLSDINLVLKDHPISWEIEDVSHEFDFGNVVTRISVTISNLYNVRQHLYILTRVRQMAEIPFCFMIKDAIRLRKEYPKKFDSIEHAFYRTLFSGYGLISDNGKYMFAYLNPIFESNRCSIRPKLSNRNLVWAGIDKYISRFRLMHPFNSFQAVLYPENEYALTNDRDFVIKTDNIFDIEYWLTGYHRRLPVYLKEKSDEEYQKYTEDYRFKGDLVSAWRNFSKVLNSKEK